MRAAGARHAALRTLARVAIAVLAALLLAAPVAHDVADHGPSPAHCQLCTARPLAVRAEPAVTAAAPALDAAGDVSGPRRAAPEAPPLVRTSGRAPPA